MTYKEELAAEIKALKFGEESIYELKKLITNVCTHIDVVAPNERNNTVVLFTNADALIGNPIERNFKAVKEDAREVCRFFPTVRMTQALDTT